MNKKKMMLVLMSSLVLLVLSSFVSSAACSPPACNDCKTDAELGTCYKQARVTYSDENSYCKTEACRNAWKGNTQTATPSAGTAPAAPAPSTACARMECKYGCTSGDTGCNSPPTSPITPAAGGTLPPKGGNYHVERIEITVGEDKINGKSFTPDPDKWNEVYFYDTNNVLYKCSALSGNKCVNWNKVPDADKPFWTSPNSGVYDKIGKEFGENSRFDTWLNNWRKPLYKDECDKINHPVSCALTIPGWARGLGQTYFDLLVKWNWLDDDFIFGDMFKPLLDFYATTWGGVFSGNWEESICRFTTDYDNAAGEGFAFTPGTTTPGAWIGGEVYVVSHPDISNPSENKIKEQYYIITLSVNAAGLTRKSGEDCEGRVKFYIQAGEKKIDIDGNGQYDTVDLKCDDSYSLTGGNAIVINSSSYWFSRVCLHFKDTEDLAPAFTEQLEGGDEICKDITKVGESPDIADCGAYCAGTLTGAEIGGVDMDIDMGGGGGGEEGEDPSVKPKPGGTGQPGLV